MNEVKIEGKAREWGWGIQETGVGPGTGGVLSGGGGGPAGARRSRMLLTYKPATYCSL